MNNEYFTEFRRLVLAAKGGPVTVTPDTLRRCLAGADFNRLAPQCWDNQAAHLLTPIVLSPEQAAFAMNAAEQIIARRVAWALES